MKTEELCSRNSRAAGRTIAVFMLLVSGWMGGMEPCEAAGPVAKNNRAEALTWTDLTKEVFAEATAVQKKRWMAKMLPELKLEGPRTTKGLEVLDWGLRDKDLEVRRAATDEALEFIRHLRNNCRGLRAGKLPVKRELVAAVDEGLIAMFDDPDRMVRANALLARIWLRGVGGVGPELAGPALKVIGELSEDIAAEWYKQETLIRLMHSAGYPADQLPPIYPHPNSVKKGEPKVGTKLTGPGQTKDNTWFDFLENSIP